ncbi:hypothetical protein [Mesorhizobium onobrychidis]|uniref:Uncharacterized protein n=1 Tax=Mesorhizobium onobrychidis TaxID=2775404 RepID=A0ABY5QU64_9HYPH|nr:hypothetical protein [Mesorhizobium onobrychidis]UVC14736.1 hypothetical protein IHQ72_29665 [Mesorhizobium onobrychidis]
MTETGLSAYRFGILAAKNGRLVERLRNGGRIWPETELEIRAFMMSRRRDKPTAPSQEQAA